MYKERKRDRRGYYFLLFSTKEYRGVSFHKQIDSSFDSCASVVFVVSQRLGRVRSQKNRYSHLISSSIVKDPTGE